MNERIEKEELQRVRGCTRYSCDGNWQCLRASEQVRWRMFAAQINVFVFLHPIILDHMLAATSNWFNLKIETKMPSKKARRKEESAKELGCVWVNVWYFHVSILQKLDLKLSGARVCFIKLVFLFRFVESYKWVCFPTYITDRHVYTVIRHRSNPCRAWNYFINIIFMGKASAHETISSSTKHNEIKENNFCIISPAREELFIIPRNNLMFDEKVSSGRTFTYVRCI